MQNLELMTEKMKTITVSKTIKIEEVRYKIKEEEIEVYLWITINDNESFDTNTKSSRQSREKKVFRDLKRDKKGMRGVGIFEYK